MRSLKQVFFIGLAISVAIVFYGLVKTNRNKSSLKTFDVDLECFGVISQISIDTMNHATPSFLINGEWIYLGSFGRSIRFIVSPDDSISKMRGNSYLELFKKESNEYNSVQRIEAW